MFYNIIATFIDNDLPNQRESVRPSVRPTFENTPGTAQGHRKAESGNLMGKVDRARSVITHSDPNIKLNRLGVPLKVAQNLTFPGGGKQV